MWGLREQEDNFGTNYSPESKRPFLYFERYNSGRDIRDVESKTKRRSFTTKNPILFIDEIHRFSKSQQDSLLGKKRLDNTNCHHRKPSFE
jgi:hypothetical protein